MSPSGPPTGLEIWKIARRATEIIKSYITDNVCLFGSAASVLWADIDRVPNDIDFVVSCGLDAEDIKETIVAMDDRYYLEQSRKRGLGKTYHILYCRLPGWTSDPERRLKVDILVPPTLKLPEITESDVVLFDDIPVMPLFDLLVMKTQGWWDHLNSQRPDFQAKADDDVSDVLALLRRARMEGVSFDNELDKYCHSEEFMIHALTLVNRFVSVHGRHRQWRALQFPL